jgi:hypothetical protein
MKEAKVLIFFQKNQNFYFLHSLQIPSFLIQ